MTFSFDTRSASASLLLAVASAGAWAACTGTSDGDDRAPTGNTSGSGSGGGNGSTGGSSGDGAGNGNSAGAGAGNGAGGATGASGLPCEVQSFLQARCQSCHTTPLAGGAPMPLTSRDELVATNSGGVAFSERALARIKDGTMPPGAALAAADYKPFEDWVAAGAPAGDCGGVAEDPLNAAPTCTSGRTGLACEPEDEGEDDATRVPADGPGCEIGSRMNPGRPCVSCHAASGGDGPALWFGGTVYPTGHEPDLCEGGPPAGESAQVVVTDANGVEYAADVNAVGNFLLEVADAAGFAYPLRAKVVYQGRERAMGTAQMSGDCNSCHTQQGDYAPGRITLPP